MRTLPLALLLAACPTAEDTSETGETGDSAVPSPLTATLEPRPSAPYLHELRHGPDGVYGNGVDGLHRSTDGIAWTRVDDPVHEATWTTAGLYGLVFDETIGQGGGYRVEQIETSGRTVLDAPWDGLDVTTVDLAASGDVLWVQVGSRASDTELDQARFYRRGPSDSAFAEVAQPVPSADVPLWGMEPDGSGGLWVWDISSSGSWTIQSTTDGSAWSVLSDTLDRSASEVVRTQAGNWVVAENGSFGPRLLRSEDDGQSFTEVLAGPTRVAVAPGGRIVGFDWLDSSRVWFSEDDGRTWTANPASRPYTQYTNNLLAMDDRLLISDLGLVVVREDGGDWGIRALPAGPGHDYLALDLRGDRGIVSLRDDYLLVDTRFQGTLITTDGGESWVRTAASTYAAGTAVCGGALGWFVGGTTGMSGPDGLGLGYAYLSADGREVTFQGVVREVRGEFANQADYRFWEQTGEIVDCEWDDNASIPGGGHVAYAFATDGAGGVLVEGTEWVDLGLDTASAKPTALRGGSYGAQAAVNRTTQGQGVPEYWSGTELMGWFGLVQSTAVVDGSRDVWAFSDGTLGTAGYIGNERYQTLPVQLDGYPQRTSGGPVPMRAAGTDGQGRVWVATAEGLYRSVAPLIE
ncbi:MAG: hypothetical protein EP330_16440 [Deltaproteobacteria bacterium]|nr:MAG: hypothetical protein EP330_16440 [Deltaproteobacteria bacterium]